MLRGDGLGAEENMSYSSFRAVSVSSIVRSCFLAVVLGVELSFISEKGPGVAFRAMAPARRTGTATCAVRRGGSRQQAESSKSHSDTCTGKKNLVLSARIIILSFKLSS